jgi:hypothetical protein
LKVRRLPIKGGEEKTNKDQNDCSTGACPKKMKTSIFLKNYQRYEDFEVKFGISWQNTPLDKVFGVLGTSGTIGGQIFGRVGALWMPKPQKSHFLVESLPEDLQRKSKRMKVCKSDQLNSPSVAGSISIVLRTQELINPIGQAPLA